MNKETPLWRIFLGGIIIASILAVLDLNHLATDKGFSLTQPKWLILSISIAITGMSAVFIFALIGRKSFEKLEKSYDSFLSRGEKSKWLFVVFFIVTLFVLPFLALHPYLGGLFGSRLWIKMLLFFLLTFLGASFLRVAKIPFKKENEKNTWIESILIAALAQLIIYQLTMAGLYITNYPFALGWTRDSRYYYASLFFSERIYGQSLPLPILHPSLHFILSLPFLFGKVPLWINRAWSVLLTLGLSWAVSATLFKKYRKSTLTIFFTIWAFLFLVQGSIYAHLLIPTLIIFLFTSPENRKRSWVAIIIASAWAGVSRINWFPVPAMLAALIYFLDTETQKVFKGTNENNASEEEGEHFQIGDEKTFGFLLRYFALPAAWFFTGIATAFLSQAIYIQLSGNGARDEFFTSLASDLLWYRLVPNATYAPGILWGATFLSLPLIILVFYASRKWEILQKIGIFSILLILFVGGLVVSVKIGGGADLHNMDAYFVSILLVGTTLLAREFESDSPRQLMRGVWLFSASLVLAWFILRGQGSFGYDKVATNAQLNALRAKSTRVAEAGDEVLFISQRHLLAVGLIENIPLIPEYEKDVLMEMVMAQNGAYMGRFYEDLHDQRFGLIVIDPQKDALLDEKRSFGAENNIWTLKVTRPLWCYYEQAALIGPVELYTPRAEPLDCD